MAGLGGRGGAVLRSQTPAGVFQEILGLMLAHPRRPLGHGRGGGPRAGVAPNRLGFTATLRILRLRLAQFSGGEQPQQHWCDAGEVAERLNAPVSKTG